VIPSKFISMDIRFCWNQSKICLLRFGPVFVIVGLCVAQGGGGLFHSLLYCSTALLLYCCSERVSEWVSMVMVTNITPYTYNHQ
jgi:hypothetical protein